MFYRFYWTPAALTPHIRKCSCFLTKRTLHFHKSRFLSWNSNQDGLHAVKSVVSIFTATLDQLLSEKAQLQAIKFLGNFIQNNNAGPDEEQVSNGYALVAATQSLTSLVQILGSSAAPALTEQIIKGFGTYFLVNQKGKLIDLI